VVRLSTQTCQHEQAADSLALVDEAPYLSSRSMNSLEGRLLDRLSYVGHLPTLVYLIATGIYHLRKRGGISVESLRLLWM